MKLAGLILCIWILAALVAASILVLGPILTFLALVIAAAWVAGPHLTS